ncbi:MAG: hypothetical protein AAF934_00735 [Bacteroidota bacterium]
MTTTAVQHSQTDRRTQPSNSQRKSRGVARQAKPTLPSGRLSIGQPKATDKQQAAQSTVRLMQMPARAIGTMPRIKPKTPAGGQGVPSVKRPPTLRSFMKNAVVAPAVDAKEKLGDIKETATALPKSFLKLSGVLPGKAEEQRTANAIPTSEEQHTAVQPTAVSATPQHESKAVEKPKEKEGKAPTPSVTDNKKNAAAGQKSSTTVQPTATGTPSATAASKPGAVKKTGTNNIPKATTAVQEEAQKNAVKEGAAPKVAVFTTPRTPDTDPNFQNTKHQINNTAKAQHTHESSASAVSKAQAAAVSPGNERMSKAQTGQIKDMDAQEAGEFDAETFKAKLKKRLEKMQLPANEEEADDFKENNNIEEVKRGAIGDVQQQKDHATGPVAHTTAEAPDVASVPKRKVAPMPKAAVGPPPAPLAANRAMPPARGVGEVNQPLQQNMAEVDQQMEADQITEQQLANSNEPEFIQALEAKKQAQTHTDKAPGQFREQEQGILKNAQGKAKTAGDTTLQGMYSTRKGMLHQVAAKQSTVASRNTTARKNIAEKIHAIYENTKLKVEESLSGLDEKVTKMFSSGAKAAKQKFEDHVAQKMAEYKRKRYGDSIFSWKQLRRIKDWARGLPEEVNAFFVSGRAKYIGYMDGVISRIANKVALTLNTAKALIARGKEEVQEYVSSLPAHLRGIGKKEAGNIQAKFDALETSVNSKQDELVNSLAQQYVDGLKAVDARIEEMKAANKGFIDRAKAFIGGIIATIRKIKSMLTTLLASALEVIGVIIMDPIGFLGMLFKGLSMGFTNFRANILKHLQSGLIEWLTGTMGPVGITIPEYLFSLKGIFSLVTQVLGITWDFIRRRAVKLLGERVVKAMETGVAIFKTLKEKGIAGLWEEIKARFNDLKETVIGGIKEMVINTVIKAGINLLLSLTSPASAFVKACMMIIDVVRFFIERGSQIIALVKAFIDSVKAIASGSVEKVAAAIENALSRAIPVLIGFLAALLNISGLANKVKKLIGKLRKRIVKVIDKVIKKARKVFGKLVNKGKTSYEKGKSAVKKGVGKLFEWWKAKKAFKAKDGKKHRLFLKGSQTAPTLMVASQPQTVFDFIQSVKIEKGNSEALNAKIKAKAKAQEIDRESKRKLAGKTDKEKNADSKKKKAKIEKLMTELASFVAVLLGIKPDELPKSVVVYKTTTRDGSLLALRTEAKILSRKGEPGSSPKETNPVYKALFLRKDGKRSYYVRGHMLNDNIHGPGVLKNLTPLSQRGNKNHLRAAEETVKNFVNSGAVVRYTVAAKYAYSVSIPTDDELQKAGIDSTKWENIKKVRKAENNVPTGLTLGADLLKRNAEGKWIKDKALVSGRGAPNIIDTNLSSYKTDKIDDVAARRVTNLKPLGLGSTGRTTAANLTEQLAMKEAMSNPLRGQIIQRMKPLSDPRWSGWRKMQFEHIGSDGSKTVIHYNGKWVDGVLKAVDDFKFK